RTRGSSSERLRLHLVEGGRDVDVVAVRGGARQRSGVAHDGGGRLRGREVWHRHRLREIADGARPGRRVLQVRVAAEDRRGYRRLGAEERVADDVGPGAVADLD